MDHSPASAAPSTLAARLGKTLAVAAAGLPNLFDESTDMFHGFSAALAASTPLTPDTFKSALAIGAGYHVDFRPASDFFDAAKDYGEPESSAFALLATLMQASLAELTVAFARRTGAVRVRMWLFGRMPSGDLAGLKTEATET